MTQQKVSNTTFRRNQSPLKRRRTSYQLSFVTLCVSSSYAATGDWRKATGRQPVDNQIPMETTHRIM